MFAPKAFCAEINFSPLFYVNSSEHELSVFGPILEITEEYTALRPIFCKESDHTDLIYPLGKITDTSLRISPFLKYERDEGEDEKSFNLFPFFYGKDPGKGYYGGVFPIYGTLKGRFGFDSATFAVWPIYSRTTIEEKNTYSLLWPIMTYSKDTKFKIFPIYGQQKENGSKSFYIVWPFFHHKETPDTHMNALLPFFSYEKGEHYKSISSPWPLFTYSKDFSASHKSIDCPWPLIRFASGAYEESRIFPVYWSRKSTNYKKKSILWPLYEKKYSEDTVFGGSTERTQILVLSGITRENMKSGEKIKTFDIWPFYRSRSEGAKSFWNIPNIIPYSEEDFSRNINRFIILMDHKKNGPCSEFDVLWHTFSHTKTESSKKSSLSFIFSCEEKDGKSRIGFLNRLVRFSGDCSNVDN
jgi:hypothetical protein